LEFDAPSGRLEVLAQKDANGGSSAQFSVVNLGNARRLTVVSTPFGRGSFHDQAREVLSALDALLDQQPIRMSIINQTIFLRDARSQPLCEQLIAAQYRSESPPTNFVLQPPCNGAALTIEAWAIGGEGVQVQRHGPHAVAVSFRDVRWVYCAGVKPKAAATAVYPQVISGLEQMRAVLAQAGSRFEHIVRTWFYLGKITEPDQNKIQRYYELNRARTDFYHGLNFCPSLLDPQAPRGVYPASSGTGTSGKSLVMGCVSLQIGRKSGFLVPLENPQQTPAYAYHPRYSPKSPKFSRAMALVLDDHITTWISGTASVINSESCYEEDIGKQTEQTIDNLERLISPENFAFHGVSGARSTLRDLAKVRVYLKRQQDFDQCRAICQRRLGAVPTVYALADICRPELLVEIEGVAFSRRESQKAITREKNGRG
jgi:enamine deaminase RidA (YjgF/YER057c/UK114 family)